MPMKFKQLVLLAVLGAGACRSKEQVLDDRPVAGREERALLEASELTLFAIDPSGDAPGAELHEYPIRKTVKIPRGEIVQVAKTVANALGRGPQANCFEPHHALRVTSGGQTFDLVICFACNEVDVVRGEEHVRWIAIDGSAEGVFAKYVGPTPGPDERWQ
jgi:hypothetical protein